MKLLDALSGRVTRSARFREYVDQSFAEVDHNANGSLDRAELHLAVMLFFDKLNAKVKKRAIPPTKAELMALFDEVDTCLLYTSPSPRDATLSRMPSSA